MRERERLFAKLGTLERLFPLDLDLDGIANCPVDGILKIFSVLSTDLPSKKTDPFWFSAT